MVFQALHFGMESKERTCTRSYHFSFRVLLLLFRCSMKISSVTLLWLTILFPFTAYADSAALVGAFGGTAYPYMDQQIKMASEKVSMTIVGNPGQHSVVTVDYTFRNTSDKTVTVLTGFPERTYFNGGDAKLTNFQAFVQGKKVEVTYRKNADMGDSPQNGPQELGWYTYPLSFAPHEEVQVRNSYESDPYGGEGSIGYRATFEYILDTGATWKGTIDTVDIEVNLKDSSLHEVATLAPLYTISNQWHISDDYKKLTLTLNNIKPTVNDNIRIFFDNRVHNSFVTGCNFKVDKVDDEDNPGVATATSFRPIDRNFSFQPGDPNDSTNTSMDSLQIDMGYFPCLAFDADPRSAWVSGNGDAHPVLTFKGIPTNRAFDAVNIIGGFRKDVSSASYQDYSRPKKIKLNFYRPHAQKETASLILNVPDNPKGSIIKFGKWVSYSETEGAKMDIEVLDTYPGKKYSNVAIAEFDLLGVPAQLSETSDLNIWLNKIETGSGSSSANPIISENNNFPPSSEANAPQLSVQSSSNSSGTIGIFSVLSLIEAIAIVVIGYLLFSKKKKV